MEWVKYDSSLGANQKLPQERKDVLVMIEPSKESDECIVVGYLRYAAGDKDSPQFIRPGIGITNAHRSVIAWCDCLPKDFTNKTYPITEKIFQK